MKLWLLAAILVLECVITYGDFHRRWFRNPMTRDMDVSWFWLGWFCVCLAQTIALVVMWFLWLS